MKLVLDELENYQIRHEPHKLLGGCSMSVNTIAGGKEINVVPDECEIKVDVRTLPGQNNAEIIADFEKILNKLKEKRAEFEGQVSVIREVGALETNAGCDFVKDFCSVVGAEETKAVGFTTDGPHLVPLGTPVVVFGPGDGDLCHKPDEYIKIADVEKAVERYKEIILRFCS
jgi:succinyl-diaminopimelate desuccinylase